MTYVRRSAALLFVAACGGGTQLAPTGPHPPHAQDFVSVAYPPPPAQIEELAVEHRDPDCAWVSGHYVWDGRNWAWQAGRWVVPPAGCYYAVPVIAWSKTGDGRLYYSPPRWYHDDASSRSATNTTCSPPKACPP